MNAAELVANGWDALNRGDWRRAQEAFEQAVALDETAEALEALGKALWWLDDQDRVLEVRERAIRLYRSAGDPRSAARVATDLAIDYADFRSDLAVSNGWLQRAESILETVPLAPEHGWLALYRGFYALLFLGDVAQARQQLDATRELIPQLGVIDIEMMSVALKGLIQIREGKLAEGMLNLDEAMTAAVGGEMSDLPAIGNTCCSLIYACEAVADYDRASQWCDRAREFCRRLGLDVFFSICRNYYAAVLIWKGSWQEAEVELEAALRELQPARTNYTGESLAKLGELRRRQGRLGEAESLFQRADPHRLSLMGRAALALDREDPQSAIDFLQRQLRRLGPEDMAEHVFALAYLVDAQIIAGDLDAAAASLAELEATVSIAGTQPLRATANAAQGRLARAQGHLDKAKLHYEDAIDLFEASEAEFDAARLRLELAAVLKQLAREAGALEQAMLAQSVFKRLGAGLYDKRAASLVSSLTENLGTPPSNGPLPHNLTPREAEVLWLIAAGRTNQEIAEELVLSIRTVERHISTIYEKLQLEGRAARASAAAIAVHLRANT